MSNYAPIVLSALLGAALAAGCGEGDGLQVLGESCAQDRDCASNRCAELVCKSSAPAGASARCTNAYECASEHCVLAAEGGYCGAGVRPEGDACDDDRQCVSARCVAGRCAATSGDGPSPALDGGVQNDGAADGSSPPEDAREMEGAPNGDAASADFPTDSAADATPSPDVSAVLNFGWSKIFGGTASDYGNSVALDSSGNLWVTGFFQGAADFGGGVLQSAGGADIFVASFTPEGQHRYSRRYGGAGNDLPNVIDVDAKGDIYLTATFQQTVDLGGGNITSAGGDSDILLASFDAAGNHRWSKGFGDVGKDFLIGLVRDGSGNLVVTGSSDGLVDFGGKRLNGAGGFDVLLASFDVDGNHRWSKRFGNAGFNLGQALAVDTNGDVVTTGAFEGDLNLGGDLLTAAGTVDFYVARFDVDGGHLWSQRFGVSGQSYSRDVALDASGNVFVIGEYDGTLALGGNTFTSLDVMDAFLFSLNSSGTHRWSRSFQGTGAQLGRRLCVGPGDDVIYVGTFAGSADFGGGDLTSAGGTDYFVGNADGLGQYRWARRFGGMGDDDAIGCALSAQGDVYLIGRFLQTVDFGDRIRTSAGAYDIFLQRLPR